MPQKKIILLFFLYLITFQVGQADTVKDPLNHFLTDLKSLEAKFTQILVNENGDEIERTRGIL